MLLLFDGVVDGAAADAVGSCASEGQLDEDCAELGAHAVIDDGLLATVHALEHVGRPHEGAAVGSTERHLVARGITYYYLATSGDALYRREGSETHLVQRLSESVDTDGVLGKTHFLAQGSSDETCNNKEGDEHKDSGPRREEVRGGEHEDNGDGHGYVAEVVEHLEPQWRPQWEAGRFDGDVHTYHGAPRCGCGSAGPFAAAPAGLGDYDPPRHPRSMIASRAPRTWRARPSPM